MILVLQLQYTKNTKKMYLLPICTETLDIIYDYLQSQMGIQGLQDLGLHQQQQQDPILDLSQLM